ncbi:MAG: type II secretion system protein [Phycisphaerales bacterium]
MTHTPLHHLSAKRRGFTLVELLVAISVIAILVAIVAVVGLGAFQNQRVATSKGLLGTLDRALEEYRLVKGEFPKYSPVDYVRRPGPSWALDASGNADSENTDLSGKAFGPDPRAPNNVRFPKKPSAAVAFRQMRGVAECESILAALPQDLFINTPRQRVTIAPFSPQAPEDDAVTILDPWSIGRGEWERTKADSNTAFPALEQSYVVYVHPENLLAQSLYGECVNGRPYFLIGGPDTKVGLREEFGLDGQPVVPRSGPPESMEAFKPRVLQGLKDNITSYPVGAPNLTEEFWDFRR